MHIAHQSPELLVVEHRPWAVGWALTALAIAGPWMLFRWLTVEGVFPTLLGVFAVDFPLVVLFTVYVRRILVVLDRRDGDVHVHEKSLVRDRDFHLPLEGLVRAERETKLRYLPFLPPHGNNHRAVLIVAENRTLRRVPLTSVYLVGPSARRATQAINHWLGREAQHPRAA